MKTKLLLDVDDYKRITGMDFAGGLSLEKWNEKYVYPHPNNKAHIRDEDRWAVWERDNFTCQECGSRKFLTIDHKKPESKGGASHIDNYQTLCGKCNRKKGNRE